MANPEWDNYDPENAELRASVISSASPLSEEEREAVERARYHVNVGMAMMSYHVNPLVAIIDRLSASAPSPEPLHNVTPDLTES